MVSRIQNRNTGYSENLFSQSPRVENNTISSIDGATALKLDESFQLDEEEQNNSINYTDNQSVAETCKLNSTENLQDSNNYPTGVSIESASYMENNNLAENENDALMNENEEEEIAPKLFSEENVLQSDENSLDTRDQTENETEQLFDQDVGEEEDFEIPAFLRKQKF
jgi:hypothetical protein